MLHFYETRNELVKVEFWGKFATITKCLANGRTLPNVQSETVSHQTWHFIKKYDNFKPRDRRVLKVAKIESEVNRAIENVEIAKLFKTVPIPKTLTNLYV